MNSKTALISTASILSLLISINSYAIDLQPGEIAAPKAGITYTQLSYANTEFNGYYSNNQKQNIDYRYNTQQLLFRLAHSFELFNMPAGIYGQIPIGQYNLHGDLSNYQRDSGVGDVTVMTAIWPYANRDSKTYLGIGFYLTLPTGSYDRARLFNISENRTKVALQVGYQTALSENVNLMMALDGIHYGDNHEYTSLNNTLSQENLYTGQMGISYKIDQQYTLAANFYHSEGGEKSINDLSNNDRINTNKYQLTAQGDYSFGRITLQFGQDISVKNGGKQDNNCIVRYTVAF